MATYTKAEQRKIAMGAVRSMARERGYLPERLGMVTIETLLEELRLTNPDLIAAKWYWEAVNADSPNQMNLFRREWRKWASVEVRNAAGRPPIQVKTPKPRKSLDELIIAVEKTPHATMRPYIDKNGDIRVRGVDFGVPLKVLYSKGDYELWIAKSHTGWISRGRSGPQPANYMLVMRQGECAYLMFESFPGSQWREVRKELCARIDQFAFHRSNDDAK